MAGTHSSADESQSLSIDTGRLWWLDDVNGKTIFFLKNRGITELRTQAVCGVGWGRDQLCTRTLDKRRFGVWGSMSDVATCRTQHLEGRKDVREELVRG